MCNIPAVIGTTGFSNQDRKKISAFAKKFGAVFSPNMSPGVNITFKLLEKAARFFADEYDVEIIESHHQKKIDAPSGTALEMARIISTSNKNLNEHDYRFARKGAIGPRKKNEIGFSVVRGGDIVGEHTVIFAGIGEVIELTHKSSSRESYTKGALLASKFLNKNPPDLYSMNDVLGL
jgi:4-hydroxy-tetrahydrodipicolinate reductase